MTNVKKKRKCKCKKSCCACLIVGIKLSAHFDDSHCHFPIYMNLMAAQKCNGAGACLRISISHMQIEQNSIIKVLKVWIAIYLFMKYIIFGMLQKNISELNIAHTSSVWYCGVH